LSNPLCDDVLNGEKGRAVVEFEKMRFELAWRQFDFHARQRTTMFHFFVLLAPFLFGGCFFLFKDRQAFGVSPAIAAALAGAVLCIVFYLLDVRNKQLYRIGKGALKLVEQQFLFTPFRPLDVSGGRYPGVMTQEGTMYDQNNFIKHGALMAIVYGLTCGMFFVLAIYFLAVGLGCINLPSPSE